MRRAALLLAIPVMLAGCAGGDDGGDEADPPDVCPADEDGAPCTDPAPAPVGVPAPILVPGTSFTFASEGVYSHEAEFTVVVVERAEGGYLLAGAEEDDLVGAIVWNNGYFGPVDEELNPLADTWMSLEQSDYFDFPLVDGKTWKSRDATVTAHAADVVTPAGSEPGFVMAIDGDTATRWEYAPSIGFVTSFTVESDRVYERFVLRSVGTSSSWVWYEPGERVEQGADTAVNPQAFELAPDAFDALVVSVGGTQGARVAVVPPPGAQGPWTWENPAAEEDWQGVILPATAGRWAYSTMDPAQGGFAWFAAVPVRWVEG